MSYSENFPSIRPSFNADFCNAGRLDSRITFSRSDTPPTYAAPSAVHYWSNEKHLSSENLLLQSSTFNTTWASNDVTRTSTASAGPDSSSAAFLVYPSTNSSNARVYQSVTVASGERGVLSVYAKQAGKTILAIVEQIGVGSLEYSYFDLTDGSDSGSSNHTRIATASGNGYYRCSIALTPNASRSGNVYFYVVDAAGSVTATASGTDGIYLFGSQYETLASGGPTAYNATTTQIHREYAPTLKSVSTAGQPRFEYSPTDSASAAMGESLGLLIEGSSTNLIAYSDDTNAWWGKVFVEAYSNAAVGPTGTLNADLIVPSATTNASHYIQRTSVTTTASTAYTYSLYVKSAGVTRFALVMFQNGSPYTHFGNAAVDLSSATINGTVGSGATIESIGNGWYRVSVTGNALTASSSVRLWFQDSSGDFTHTPNGYDGLLVAGQQFEANSFPSSLISTNGSQVTRAADSASADTSSFYTGGPVSIVAEGDSNSDYGVLALLRDSSGGGDVAYLYANPNSTNKAEVYAGGVTSTATATAGTGTSALALDTNRLAACRAGGAVTTDTSTALPVLNQLQIGSLNGSYVFLNGHVKRIALYGEALRDSNLQSLTK